MRGPRHTISRGDLLRLGAVGLRTRPMRVVLSALGIAIGIAAMIAVLGISASSQARLGQVLESLGTNMFAVAPSDLARTSGTLPATSLDSLRRRDDVESAAAVGTLDTHVYRNDLIAPEANGGISVDVPLGDLLTTLRGSLATGRWLTGDDTLPEVVLGSVAARTLGIDHLRPDTRVWMDGRWVAVVGILEPFPLAPEIDTTVMISSGLAAELGWDGLPTRAWVRVAPDAVEAVGALLGRTVSPGAPQAVTTTRPSDALAAQQASDASFTGLLVGVGGVALLVGGIGVANTMVITVLERRNEIGVRRALGARRRDVRAQFLAESLLLATLGGVGGIALGCLVTLGYAASQDWPFTMPLWGVLGGLASTTIIGALSGLWPATRAAATPPTAALAAA